MERSAKWSWLTGAQFKSARRRRNSRKVLTPWGLRNACYSATPATVAGLATNIVIACSVLVQRYQGFRGNRIHRDKRAPARCAEDRAPPKSKSPVAQARAA